MTIANKNNIFWVLMFLFTFSVILTSVYLVSQFFEPQVSRVESINIDSLSENDRQRVYSEIARRFPGIYDTLPDPNTARILQRNIDKEEAGARIMSNNAGMRSSKPYTTRPSGTYRIVCLGDSFTYGFGGQEGDRYCDQLEQFFTEHGIRVQGKQVETYALGIGSWTAFNEASYLIARFSEYDPDLIIVLIVPNDISDTQGVRGTGTITNTFSPEYRHRGSGVFNNSVPRTFGVQAINLLPYDFSGESKKRWDKAFHAWQRLENLQREAGGKLLFSVYNENPYFTELVKFYFEKYKLRSSLILTNYFPGEGGRLPHDSHPNRLGHSRISTHYLHSLAKLGWVSIDTALLPELHENLRLNSHHPPNIERLAVWRKEIAERYLHQEIDFSALKPVNTAALLGGIVPSHPDPLANPPYGTLYTAFLIGRPSLPGNVRVRLEVPARPELFPLNLNLFANGKLIHERHLASVRDSGVVELSGPIPRLGDDEECVELLITADRYWSEIERDDMFSYKLIYAGYEYE